MVRITKVVTKKGDKGTTLLTHGMRLSKASPRVEVLGNLDELNATIGLVSSIVQDNDNLRMLTPKLLRIQNELFDLGAQVVTHSEQPDAIYIQEQDVTQLEQEIIEMNASLLPLNSFIFPGGHEVSARLHLARTICRRTERAIVALNEAEKLPGLEIPFLNRLSDWFFVAARFVNQKTQTDEILWEPGRREYPLE
jgi:cob(I)alamin adenosyltransferase